MFGFFEVLYSLVVRGAVKKVQSGTSAAAGNITISSVNVTKTVVLSASKGSAGYVAATGSVSLSGSVTATSADGTTQHTDTRSTTYTKAWSLSASGSISEGSTDLTVKVYSARLDNSTTIYCDGPVEWQVIEYV